MQSNTLMSYMQRNPPSTLPSNRRQTRVASRLQLSVQTINSFYPNVFRRDRKSHPQFFGIRGDRGKAPRCGKVSLSPSQHRFQPLTINEREKFHGRPARLLLTYFPLLNGGHTRIQDSGKNRWLFMDSGLLCLTLWSCRECRMR